MKSETRTQEIFIADDDKEFISEIECKKYELEVLERIKNIKFFSVIHGADLNEGRGYSSQTKIAVECGYSPAKAFALEWCAKNIGSHLAFVQGVAPMEAWMLNDSDLKSYKEKTWKNSWGTASINHVFLSDNPLELQGFPEPIPLYKEKR